MRRPVGGGDHDQSAISRVGGYSCAVYATLCIVRNTVNVRGVQTDVQYDLYKYIDDLVAHKTLIAADLL